jgi:hypothetical protein
MLLARARQSKSINQRPSPLNLLPHPRAAVSSLSSLRTNRSNQAMQQLLLSGLLQPKLAVAGPDTPQEREADRFANGITQQIPSSSNTTSPLVDARDGAANSAETKSQRAPRTSSSVAQTPPIVERALGSAGNTLDSGTRSFFEAHFGHDFSGVRVHTGDGAVASARSIDAHAYTLGSHIVFDAGLYSPQSFAGRRLLAHELTHVVQQSTSPPGTGAVIQRDPADKKNDKPIEIPDKPDEEKLWTQRVNAAVRKEFELKDPGLSSTNVTFLDEKQFAARYPIDNLRKELIYVFWAEGDDLSTEVGRIWQSMTGHQFLGSGFPPNPRTSMGEVEAIVDKGIKDKKFWHHHLTDPYKELTPREVLASAYSGVTKMTGPKTSSINIEHFAFVSTLVHEACHFFATKAYLDAVGNRKDRDKLIGGAFVRKILIEGLAEYFAREVMDKNVSTLGHKFELYQPEYLQAVQLAQAVGEQSLRDAYFKGDPSEIKNLMKAVDSLKKKP